MTTLFSTALAQINLVPKSATFSGLSVINVSTIISAIIILLLVIAALVFFIMLVVGGIRYITSGGDKAATESARGQITAALIGLVIVFAAWAIINLVSLFFGINILNLAVPNAQTGS